MMQDTMEKRDNSGGVEGTHGVQKHLHSVLGGTICVYEAGDPSLQKIVMLHGAMYDESRFIWDALFPALSERYHVFAVDTPRHGGSRPWAGLLDRAKLMEILAETLAQLKLTRFSFVGLSMGGAQACYIGLNNADTFAWVAGFSGAYVMYGSSALPGAPRPPLDGSAFEKRFPALGPPVGAKLRLFWLGMGVDDGLLEPHRQFAAWLASKGVRPTTVETPGGHTWMVWRRNLAEVAPMLFQEKTR